VVTEVVLVSKGLSTDVASKGLVFNMSLPVVFEKVYTVEALIAAATLILFLRMQGQMSIECFLIREGGLTLRTCLQVVNIDYMVTEGERG